jgi:hypothetical protein
MSTFIQPHVNDSDENTVDAVETVVETELDLDAEEYLGEVSDLDDDDDDTDYDDQDSGEDSEEDSDQDGADTDAVTETEAPAEATVDPEEAFMAVLREALDVDTGGTGTLPTTMVDKVSRHYRGLRGKRGSSVMARFTTELLSEDPMVFVEKAGVLTAINAIIANPSPASADNSVPEHVLLAYRITVAEAALAHIEAEAESAEVGLVQKARDYMAEDSYKLPSTLESRIPKVVSSIKVGTKGGGGSTGSRGARTGPTFDLTGELIEYILEDSSKVHVRKEVKSALVAKGMSTGGAFDNIRPATAVNRRANRARERRSSRPLAEE